MKNTNATPAYRSAWKTWLPLTVLAAIVAVKINYFTSRYYRAETGVKTETPVIENKTGWPAAWGWGRTWETPAVDGTLQQTVADAVKGRGLNVEYWRQAPWHETELYTAAPIEVAYTVKQRAFYKQPFDFTYTGGQSFRLSYRYNNLQRERTGTFGEEIHEAELNLTVTMRETAAGQVALVAGETIRFTVYSDDALAEHLLQSSVEVANAANGGRVTVTSTVPEKAQLLANCLAARLSSAPRADLAALDKQLHAATAELADARTAWDACRRETGLPAWQDDGDAQAGLGHLLEVKTNLELQQLALDNLSQYMRDNRLSGNAVPDFGTITDPVFAGYITELNEKIAKRRQLGGGEATMLDNEIEFLKNTLAEGIRNTRKKTALQLDEINRQVAAASHTAPEGEALPAAWQASEERYQRSEQFYRFLLARKMETVYAQNVLAAAPRQEAALPRRPVNPDEAMVWALCLLGAAVPGLLITWAGRRRRARATGRNTLRVLGQLQKENTNTDAQIAELCTNMLVIKPQDASHLITVTSMQAGEGKSFVAARLAKAFAALDLKVLLADMHAAQPAQDGLLDAAPGRTLADVYTGGIALQEAVRITSIPSLDLLTGGLTGGLNAPLATGKLKETLEALKAQYDIVIVDTASLADSLEAVALVKMSDTGVLVTGQQRKETDVTRDARILTDVYGIDNLFYVQNTPAARKRGDGKIIRMRPRRGEAPGKSQGLPLFKRAALWFY